MREVRGHGTAASPVDTSVRASSYDEFVTTRGPALFRTAHLLAGSRADAEDLLQAALVRLRLVWHRARHAESSEAFATRVLVAAFLHGRPPRRLLTPRLVTVPPGSGPDPDPADRMLLWPHLDALTRRQRAVVVLGYADGLGDHQIAELLGISPPAVATTGGPALAVLESATDLGPDAVRDLLGTELRQVRETRPAPELAAEGLARLAAAERARRRKGLLTAAAVAVVLALAATLLTRLGSNDAPPARSSHGPPPRHPKTLAQLAAGADTTLPWWSGGELHVQGRVLPTNHDEVVSAAGTTLVGNLYVAGFEHTSAWWYVARDGLVPLASSTTTLFTPVVSSDGALVAWVEPLGRTRRLLVLWDVRRRHPVDSVPLRVHRPCCEQQDTVAVRGVDRQGQVFFDTGGRLRVWAPGRPVRAVRGLAGRLYEVHAYADGITWQAHAPDPLGPFPVSAGSVDDRGRVHDAGSLPNGTLWSPDGGRYAFVGEAHGSGSVRAVPGQVWVADALHVRPHRMRLPPRANYQLVAWESPTSVVVAVRRDTGRPLRGSDLPTQVQLLRCQADTGACETAGLAAQSILTLSPYY